MCELLGMNFNKPVSCQFSFKGFTNRGNGNPHGWGIALYPDGSKAAQLIKEPIRASESQIAVFTSHYTRLRSKVFVSHVRYATSEVSYANTHPFVRELNGREYSFAHNGVLLDYQEELTLGRWKPIGSTDSEYAFCHLLHFIEEFSQDWNRNSFIQLEDIMKTINRYGTFNCLLTDGEYLFCYRDRAGHKGLSYTRRKAPFNREVRLIDEDIEVNLQENKDQSEVGVIVATAPLTNEPWQEVVNGALMVFHQGKQVFPIGETNVDKEKLLHALHFIRRSEHRQSILEIVNTIGVKLDNTVQALQPLIDKGYIKQYSRDRGGPFEPFSTYYTIPSKRNEIDQLLQDDTLKSEKSLSHKNFSGAGKEDKVKACVPCLTFYKEGKSFCRKCLNRTDDMDLAIADIIFNLNEKGYKTIACCSGHGKDKGPYISFNIDTSELDSPSNFVWGQASDKNVLRMIPYYKVKGITKKKMERTINEVELEAFSLNNLEELRGWVKRLPAE